MTSAHRHIGTSAQITASLLALIWLSPETFAARIVSLKPNITRSLMALGADNDIVGVTRFCPKPNDDARVIADYVSVNAEAIIRLKPDLIISSTENSQNRQYEILSAAGLKLEILDFSTVAKFLESLVKLGRLVGRNVEAIGLTKQLEGNLAVVKKKHADAVATFAVIVQRQPLMTASGTTYISTLFESAGWRNLFHDNRIPYPVLAPETLIAQRPDFLFDMSHGADHGKDFHSIKVIPLKIDDYLAEPGSVGRFIELTGRLVVP